MALKVELKPGERMILGKSVITNGDQRTRLKIDGDSPILREKDIITAEQADTCAKRVYLTVQLMYFSDTPSIYHDMYFALIKDIIKAAPSTLLIINEINDNILGGELYRALKACKQLIEYEKELLKNVFSGDEGLRSSESENTHRAGARSQRTDESSDAA